MEDFIAGMWAGAGITLVSIALVSLILFVTVFREREGE